MKHKAFQILTDNWENGYTIPSKNLYPFQWFWDSGFIAIGYAHFDLNKALTEIQTLFNAQWKNGFIPHIIFHKQSDTYFPGPEFHQAHLHPLANKKYPSTGMTQPPVTGFVLEKILEIASDKPKVLKFIEKNIDKVFSNHHYFYTHRDPNNEGLAYIYHNWESGTDNSPIWDAIWDTFDAPEISFRRLDTNVVNASERPTNKDYYNYLHLINIAKKYHYNDDEIAKNSPFLIQDPLFNAILIKSNQALINLYKKIGGHQHKINQLKTWQSKSISSFNKKLFNKELNAYVHFDLRNNRPIPMVSSSSFAALFAGIPTKDIAKKLINTLRLKFKKDTLYLCASFDPTHKKYDPVKYWRGPVWVNLNWMLYYGLNAYGYTDLAETIKKDTLELVEKAGFYEYFDAQKASYSKNSSGCGGSNFSWTAALFIDLLNTK